MIHLYRDQWKAHLALHRSPPQVWGTFSAGMDLGLGKGVFMGHVSNENWYQTWCQFSFQSVLCDGRRPIANLTIWLRRRVASAHVHLNTSPCSFIIRKLTLIFFNTHTCFFCVPPSTLTGWGADELEDDSTVLVSAEAVRDLGRSHGSGIWQRGFHGTCVNRVTHIKLGVLVLYR